MNICVVGCGYVGLTTGTVLSHFGHKVTCIDIDEGKVDSLNSGKCIIHEDGLEPMLQKQLECETLKFSTDIHTHMRKNEIIIIAVGTPSNGTGQTDLTYIDQVIEYIESLKADQHFQTIVIKSTVPPGTNDYVRNRLLQSGRDKDSFSVISNPEFLREGTAVYDLLHPDKIVVGGRDPLELELIRKMYGYLPSKYFFTSPITAEITKYASNAFLATKISFINEIQRICEAYKGDVSVVAEAIGCDPRIGPDFLKAGLGYGGYCLPKDIQSLTHSAIDKGIVPSLLHAVERVNHSQVDLYIDLLEKEMGTLKDRDITVWGLAFKPNTDDTRDSPSFRLIDGLVDKGSEITAYDPAASGTPKAINVSKDQYESVKGSDVLIIATDWKPFIEADWKRVKALMKGSIIIDARNCLNASIVRQAGLKYLAVGRH
ncbi:UDP-glucose dehydrogenase family protein [Pseudalkalibacillus salsuginis]|uniref:UDP-glucose dehydrogenase family protein n=1 Tax=Pseudalkalibacillus salsuginis TaxID=2910972 RepID=UPI001F430FEF|nr:UDP-glucose/GDP-mannose dehydrogenase family protein [Pseudalkalibacillus salsuginis]MCF6409145.1 UDP-glucose/GDP-mannose dehydrogenase family protein [Pseudalkalibacillus salsuginis]